MEQLCQDIGIRTDIDKQKALDLYEQVAKLENKVARMDMKLKEI